MLRRHGVGVIDLGAVDLLEGLHRADRAGEFKVGIVADEIADMIEGERRDAVGRHEIPYRHPHLRKIPVGRGSRVMPVFDAENGMDVRRPVIDFLARYAQAYDRWLAKKVSIRIRADELPEQVAVQIAEVIWHPAAPRPEVTRQDNAEIVIPHVRREVVADYPIDALAAVPVGDDGVQDFDQRKRLVAVVAVVVDGERRRDDLQLHRIAIACRIIPVHQRVEPAIDHHQRVAQVLPAAFPAGEVRKVGG